MSRGDLVLFTLRDEPPITVHAVDIALEVRAANADELVSWLGNRREILRAGLAAISSWVEVIYDVWLSLYGSTLNNRGD